MCFSWSDWAHGFGGGSPQCPSHPIPSRLLLLLTWLTSVAIDLVHLVRWCVPGVSSVKFLFITPPPSTPPLGRKPPLRTWFLCLEDCSLPPLPHPPRAEHLHKLLGILCTGDGSSPLRICLVIDLCRDGLMLWTFSMPIRRLLSPCWHIYVIVDFFRLPYFLAGSSFSCGLPAPALESVISPWNPDSFYWEGFRNPDLEHRVTWIYHHNPSRVHMGTRSTGSLSVRTFS